MQLRTLGVAGLLVSPIGLGLALVALAELPEIYWETRRQLPWN